MTNDFYNFETEISPLGELYAAAHFALIGDREYPIDPEIIAMKYHGLEIRPVPGLNSVHVQAGIDATQSVLFIDRDLYMNDNLQHIVRQTIAHELGHVVFDNAAIKQNVPSTVKESFAAHSILTKRPGLETRANMFAGSFLVPRHELVKRVAQIIYASIDDLKRQHENMLVIDVIQALAASKLTNQFNVSESVIEWRLKSEGVAELLGGANGRVADIDETLLEELSETLPPTHSITERVLRLIPNELAVFLSKGTTM